jgi:hypothetical protein
MREEKNEIVVKQQGLARPEATCAALIPIRKTQLGGNSRKTSAGAFSKSQSTSKSGSTTACSSAQAHHCRDLSENEPFDFLNWFEFAPTHEAEFNALLSELRATEEWKYVDREVDIRLVRGGVGHPRLTAQRR